MKKLLILIIVGMLSEVEASKGQTNFPAHGADWHYLVQSGGFSGPTTYSNTEVKYTHDTLFMGKTAKMLATNISYYTMVGISSGNVFVYTSNDSVFFYNSKTLSQWQLLYSFNTPVGQSWQIQLQDNSGIDTIHIKVDSVKNTLINAVLLKTLFVTYNEGSFIHHSIIYDRIGDINYLFNFYSNEWGLCDGCTQLSGLLCYNDSAFGLYQPDTTKSCNYTTGIRQFANSNAVSIYPNPANTIINLTIGQFDNLKMNSVEIFNMLGESVHHQILKSSNCQIDVSDLSEGIYNINISSNAGVVNKRLVIVR